MADQTTQKTEATPAGELVDGIYTEDNVTLTNGRVISVEVITDKKKLPATFGNLLAEGNSIAMTIAMLTTKTRRILDYSGATVEDIESVLAPVIDRARDAADKES